MHRKRSDLSKVRSYLNELFRINKEPDLFTFFYSEQKKSEFDLIYYLIVF